MSASSDPQSGPCRVVLARPDDPITPPGGLLSTNPLCGNTGPARLVADGVHEETIPVCAEHWPLREAGFAIEYWGTDPVILPHPLFTLAS